MNSFEFCKQSLGVGEKHPQIQASLSQNLIDFDHASVIGREHWTCFQFLKFLQFLKGDTGMNSVHLIDSLYDFIVAF